MRNNGYYEDRDTEFAVNGEKHTAHEWGDGLVVYNLTPEQAIAATLGSDREADLEALAKDLYVSANGFNFPAWVSYYKEWFAALGIEVNG